MSGEIYNRPERKWKIILSADEQVTKKQIENWMNYIEKCAPISTESVEEFATVVFSEDYDITITIPDIPKEEFGKIEDEVCKPSAINYGHISGEYLCVRLPKVKIIYKVKNSQGDY